MKLSTDEMRLLVVVSISAPQGEALPVARLEEFFDRPCKLRKAVASLTRWGLLAHDPFASQVRLLARPVLRALSCAPALTLPLFSLERPLDAALAAVQQAEVPARNPEPQLRAPGLAADADPPAARVPAHAACVPEHVPRVPEHKMRPPDDTYVTSTSKRENVSTIKRETSTCAPVDSAALQARVRAFVGEADFNLKWARNRFWEDVERCRVLDGSLRYLSAGLKEGTITTRTSAGRHLWSQFRIDCQSRGLNALV